MLATQAPSGPAAAVVTGVQAEPALVYSTASGAPAGEEPSAKRSEPETATGVTPRWLEALTVSAETGTA